MRVLEQALMGILLQGKHPLYEVQHREVLLLGQRNAVEFAATTTLSFPRRRVAAPRESINPHSCAR